MTEQQSRSPVNPAHRDAAARSIRAAERSAAAEEHDYIRRARLAVLRNVGLAAVIALGCVLLVLLVFNRPLVYRIFPWAEPQPDVIDPFDVPARDEGIYWTETKEGFQMLVADPTLRPDLYVTIEFTYACGCKGSFIPAYGDQYEMLYPERAKAKYEQLICPKCRKALEYLEDKEQQDSLQDSEQDSERDSGD